MILSASYLHSSLNISEQASHPYQTPGKPEVLNNLISMFFESKQEYKNSKPNGSMHSLNVTYLNFFVYAILIG
jgi:hypothetical protein